MNSSSENFIANGKYRIDGTIGHGAFGVVYKAWDTLLERDVAIKELYRHTLGMGDELFREYLLRFRCEAQVQAQFNHPNLVHVYELIEHDNVLYLIMEYVDGKSLKEHLSWVGSLAVEEAVRLGIELLEAVEVVHAHPIGLVHRDIKPSNVLLTAPDAKGKRHVKLTDFGLAQVGHISGRSLGKAGHHPGTLLYMSPEQECTIGYLKSPSDLYSVGCVLFEMLTGQPYKQLEAGVDLNQTYPFLPSALVEILLRAIEKESHLRYQSAVDFRSALRSLSAESKLVQTAASSPAVTTGASPLLLVILGLLTLLASLSAVVIGLLLANPLTDSISSSISTTPTAIYPLATLSPTVAPTSVPALVPANTYVEYILDASNGMLRSWNGGGTRLESAKSALVEHWRALDPAFNVGFRAYGHRRDVWDDMTCQDIELMVPIDVWQLEELQEHLSGIQAQGLDSLAAALRLALGDFTHFSDAERLNAVVLITDGWESDNRCGDLSAVVTLVRNQRETGIALPIYILGLDVPTDQAEQLRTIAEISNGQFYAVSEPQSLREALESVTQILNDLSD